MTTAEISPIPHAPSATEMARREAYLRDLIEESQRHRALTHPWLTAMAGGDFPDLVWALRDYAWHYHGFCAWYPDYLETVLASLDCAEHRRLLQENLLQKKWQVRWSEKSEGEREETCEETCEEPCEGEERDSDRAALRQVGIDANSVRGVPHAGLFRRFCAGLGLGDADLRDPSEATLRWRREFRDYLQQCSPAAAVGALGLGTKDIVAPIYTQTLSVIQELGLLSDADYLFFELYRLVDHHHRTDLLAVARDLASDQGTRAQVREGMLRALDLRVELWDHLYGRATTYRRVFYA